MMYLIDTGVLLRMHDEDDPRHVQCQSAIDLLRNRGESLFVCTQVVAEFWVVLTRPRDVNGLGVDFDDAVLEMADLRASFPCLADPPDLADRWFAVVSSTRTMGRQAHDARIAALMLASGVTTLLTLNPTDFTRYAGITPVTPQETLQHLSS
jgi:predicted nucleic acid-binding protein